MLNSVVSFMLMIFKWLTSATWWRW